MKNMVADLLDGDHRLRIMNHLEWSPTVVENVKTSLELMAKMEAMGVFSKQDTSALTKLLMKSNCVIAAEIAGDYRPENLYVSSHNCDPVHSAETSPCNATIMNQHWQLGATLVEKCLTLQQIFF